MKRNSDDLCELNLPFVDRPRGIVKLILFPVIGNLMLPLLHEIKKDVSQHLLHLVIVIQVIERSLSFSR